MKLSLEVFLRERERDGKMRPLSTFRDDRRGRSLGFIFGNQAEPLMEG